MVDENRVYTIWRPHCLHLLLISSVTDLFENELRLEMTFFSAFYLIKFVLKRGIENKSNQAYVMHAHKSFQLQE